MINIYKSGKYDITLEFDNFGLYNILNAFKKLKNKENATIECECKKIIFKNNSMDNIYNYIEIKKQSITFEICDDDIVTLYEFFYDCSMLNKLLDDDELFTCIYKGKTFTIYPVYDI